MLTLTCETCGKSFESAVASEDPICYSCALTEIANGHPPEVSDLTTAALLSGEMSEKEWQWLQEDLQAAEAGRSIREYEPPEYAELEECNDCDVRCDECGTDIEPDQRLCAYCAAIAKS